MANPEKSFYDIVHETAADILKKTQYRPQIGIICGSGLGTLVEVLENPVRVPYSDIPTFPKSTVAGHEGNLVFGVLGGKPVLCMQGRFHPYEGYNTYTCTLPVRVMHAIGVKVLLATNASGGLNPKYKVGDFCVVKDHINFPGLAGQSPLNGPNDERFGPRFLPLSNAYDRDLQNLAFTEGEKMHLTESMHSGVYAMQWGPCYETIAEARMLHQMGGDVVGMSTTHEVIVARHHGMRVLTLSLVTNRVIMDYDSTATVNHEEVLVTGRIRAEVMKQLITNIVKELTL